MTLVVGDPSEDGARAQLVFPYQAGCERVRQGARRYRCTLIAAHPYQAGCERVRQRAALATVFDCCASDMALETLR